MDCERILDLDETPIDYRPATVFTQSVAESNDKNTDRLQRFPGLSTFSTGFLEKPKRKRAKFDTQSREKVAKIRKIGACLRCRVLKIPVKSPTLLCTLQLSFCEQCSGSRPCNSCTHHSISCHAREPKHMWMDCVPYWLKDCDIYSRQKICSQTSWIVTSVGLFGSCLRPRRFFITGEWTPIT